MVAFPQHRPFITEDDTIFSGMAHQVAVVWFMSDFPGAHVALSVDGTLRGFRSGHLAQECSSLNSAIYKAKTGGASKFTILRVMPIDVTEEGYQILKEWKKRTFYPCTNCMHAVARILAATTKIRIPFLISQSPSLSEVYLRNLHRRGAKEIGYTFEYTRNRKVQINPDLLSGAVGAVIDGLTTTFFTLSPVAMSLSENYWAVASIYTFSIALMCKQLWDTRHYIGEYYEESPLDLEKITNNVGKAIIVPQDFQNSLEGAQGVQQEVEWGMRNLAGQHETLQRDLALVRKGYLTGLRVAKKHLNKKLKEDQEKIASIFGRFSHFIQPFYSSKEAREAKRHVTALQEGLKATEKASQQLVNISKTLV